ncbi:endonuclease [Gordonia phage Yvonnetastic]|uniref:HNH endonuclease n=1 Tax=Gordonia phage Yvonnetastic TaxID=1821566 RepID=A0A142K975_9CAUD|nr:endonuclease [Gordonia phage Yvonnetastic]AMS02658.1 HNH endonuclease [Gordonia phage Yvonnetastic]
MIVMSEHNQDWLPRFHSGYRIEPSGCHVWQKATNNRGYGVMYLNGKLQLAHRVAFFSRHGRWPQRGLVIDHLCENKPCVNPDHLREIENWRNVRRPREVGSTDQERRREQWRIRQARCRGSYSSTYEAKR